MVFELVLGVDRIGYLLADESQPVLFFIRSHVLTNRLGEV